MELDTSWITNFENLENEYNLFYKAKVTEISMFSIYINRDNEVIKIKKDKINNLTNNTINKNNLIYFIKKNNLYNNIKYKLISILKFNIDIDALNINNFLKSQTPPETQETQENIINTPYLSVIKNINDIRFNNTINIFQDINSIFFIYYNDTIQNTNNLHTTKKVYINTNKQRKTKRKPA